MKVKMVYFFGGGKADGNGGMKDLLGGKGANLAEMAGHSELRLPVPPGFTITTDVCTHYYRNKGTYPPGLKSDVERALRRVESLMKRGFGDSENPLLVSVRSGARKSMPGMMETVLNVGLTEKTIPGLIRKSGNDRFVYDAYRRLIMMYSDVVMEKAAGIGPEDGDSGIRRQLERIMEMKKKEKGYRNDTEMTSEDLKDICRLFKKKVSKVLKKDFPDDPMEQLWGGIGAVFSSWNGKRAVAYRRIEGIPDDWGTAVNVQAMVFGNMGKDCATGVAFTRNPGNGENKFYGEYLVNAQGEDVVAGTRTPAPINEYSKTEHNRELMTLERAMPGIYRELVNYRNKLEKHYRDMQDIEFTIESGKLFMLQTRTGKRNGPAALKMAMDMQASGMITNEEAIMRVSPNQLDELLHPIVDPKEEKTKEPLAKGLPAGPGAAAGQIVFTAKDAVEWKANGKDVILVREETNPEDVDGMRAANAILTARGGMTSHAALVARGWGKCCIVGAGDIEVEAGSKRMAKGDVVLEEGEWITLNGTRGLVYKGKIPMIDASRENKYLKEFLGFCDSSRRLGIRTNADTPEDAAKAREFGAEGIGLFRTEHMFYGKGSEEPLFRLRKMIMSDTEEERRKALSELFPYMKKDIMETLSAMDGLPVVIRLLDPPLHEFVPRDESKLKRLSRELKISGAELKERAEKLRETNPMMGHRGVRLGITYPEISETQIRAIFEAAAELLKKGKKPYPEIMIPVVSGASEIENQFMIARRVYKGVLKKHGLRRIRHKFGTMIEIPRACFSADKIADFAEFFSFGTNDLTQMGFGFSRDDIGSFLKDYIDKGIISEDPFQSIDQEGIGEMVKEAVKRGRDARKELEIGICGEHGGDPKSIDFFHRTGLDYVSCSPFRIPIARLSAAQARIRERRSARNRH